MLNFFLASLGQVFVSNLGNIHWDLNGLFACQKDLKVKAGPLQKKYPITKLFNFFLKKAPRSRKRVKYKTETKLTQNNPCVPFSNHF